MAKFTKLNIGDAVASSGGRVWKKLSAESAIDDSTLVGTWVLPNDGTYTAFTSQTSYKFNQGACTMSMDGVGEISNNSNYVLKTNDANSRLRGFYKSSDLVFPCFSVNSGSISYAIDGNGWRSASAPLYITITENPVSGDADLLLSWLKANATKIA